MKKKMLLLSFLFIIQSLSAQNVSAVVGNEKNVKLYISFSYSLSFDYSNDIALQAIVLVPQLSRILKKYPFTLKKAIPISDEKLNQMEKASVKNGFESTSINNLKNIFEIEVANSDDSSLIELAKELTNIEGIRYCELMNVSVPPPPGDILPITPNFMSSQGYIGPNPGVNIQYAWNLGITGSNVRIRDIEYGFNKDHEEFNTNVNARIATGMNISSQVPQYWKEHGTAVYGIIYGDNGSYGITGLAHDAQEVIFYPEWQESGLNRINAISQAINQSTNGDIIVYEMQDYGQDNNLVVAEINNVVWDLTKAATESGITVVAAAGNSSQNLDSDYYTSYRNRGDSGAIIVGAGTPNLEHNWYFSTSGTRVDVHAWGANVFSSGYSPIINSDINQSYSNFSGTSAATAIVASCAAVLQSYYFSLYNAYLSSIQLRSILKLTGIAQGSGGHIGPLPNMQNAIQYVNTLGLNNPDNHYFYIALNPTQDIIEIHTQEKIVDVLLFDMLGKKLNVNQVSTSQIDVSNLSSGIYIIKLIGENNQSSSAKFSKG